MPRDGAQPVKRRKLNRLPTKPWQNDLVPVIGTRQLHEPYQGERDSIEGLGANLDPDVASDDDSGSRQNDEPLSESSSFGESSLHVDLEDLQDDTERKQKGALHTLSFGALVDAQDALSPDRREPVSSSNEPIAEQSQEYKLQGLRARLAELREKKGGHKSMKDVRNEGLGDHQRSSKHAPTEQSSRKQVTRRREVTDTSHLYDTQSRAHAIQGDPRFSNAAGKVDQERIRRNYRFLDAYTQKELQDLKTALDEGSNRRRGKLTEQQQADLKKEIGRKENRIKAEAQKERERVIASKHKKEERHKIREGKTPFYLKRGQIKEQARKEAWDGMKQKDRDKAEQKKRRRQEAKEMKRKPGERRVQE